MISHGLDRAALLKQLDDAEVLGLPKSLKEHKAVHLAVLDLSRSHPLNRIRKGHTAGLKHVQGQFYILVHFSRVTVVLVVNQLAHLSLIGLVASDHGDQVAKSYPVPEILEAGNQQTACIIE